ncbi:MAG: cyclic pyranopterin monophosphate synthase MoaC [Acidimicrobiia bacterium]|nr:cyclic pyranopterin monophosphate synthase MoaC [Acidimicrobiia bacterium]
MGDMNHLDEYGNAHMVDVGDKMVSRRSATAVAEITMDAETVERIFAGDTPKGDVLATVRIAAIQATKKTPDLIPLCHPLNLASVSVDIEPFDTVVRISVTASLQGRTGVEMEAMTGAAIGAIAMYDMIKGIDRSAEVTSVRLEHKVGGRTGEWTRA